MDNSIINEKDYILQLSRVAIETYICKGTVLKPEYLPEFMKTQKGVFIIIKNFNGLRSCAGAIFPLHKNLQEEIINNSISAAVFDPRYPQIEKNEMTEINISVVIIEEPEIIKSEKELNPQNFGIIVSSGEKLGIMLPDLAGVITVEKQIEIAKNKGGITQNEKYDIKRFKTTLYYEQNFKKTINNLISKKV